MAAWTETDWTARIAEHKAICRLCQQGWPCQQRRGMESIARDPEAYEAYERVANVDPWASPCGDDGCICSHSSHSDCEP